MRTEEATRAARQLQELHDVLQGLGRVTHDTKFTYQAEGVALAAQVLSITLTNAALSTSDAHLTPNGQEVEQWR